MTFYRSQNYKDSKKVSGCQGMLESEGYIGPKHFWGMRCSVWNHTDILTYIYTVIHLSKPARYRLLRGNSHENYGHEVDKIYQCRCICYLECTTVAWIVATVKSCESMGSGKTRELRTCWFNCESRSALKKQIMIYNAYFWHVF